jgi:protein-L-isoaspartate(D-aspartate) O-methyltransferase
MRAEEFDIARRRMLAEISARAVQLRQITGRAAFDERVMTAMGRVQRHEFVPIEFQPFAYANIPVPIGFDKTISQPYIVALMNGFA